MKSLSFMKDIRVLLEIVLSLSVEDKIGNISIIEEKNDKNDSSNKTEKK